MRIRRSKREQPDIVPIVVRTTGTRGEVVAFGHPSALAKIGAQLDRVPAPVVRAARAMVGSIAEFATSADDLSGAWLKLTPQARRLLDTHSSVSAGDGLVDTAILGVVRDANGRFAGHLSFVELKTAGALANAPALAASAALQLQMAAIEQRLEGIHRDLGYLIGNVHVDIEAELAANFDILDQVYEEVKVVGDLTDTHWARVVSIEASVRRLHHRSGGHLRQLEEALTADALGIGARVGQLKHAIQTNHTDLWLDVHVHAEKALTQWQSLYLLRQIDEHPERASEFVGAMKAEVALRFDALVQLGEAIASSLDVGHKRLWTDRFRIISQTRLRHLLAELDQVLASYRTGIASVQLSGEATGALAAADFGVGTWGDVSPMARAADTKILEGIRRTGSGLGRRTLVRAGTALERIRPTQPSRDEQLSSDD